MLDWLSAPSPGHNGVSLSINTKPCISQYPPKPYSFNYQVTDDHGNVHFRREQSDPSGTVSGSYGYMHINGLYRTVEYVANAEGFKAQVKSNEPGVGVGGPSPADVQLTVEPVPPGVQDAYVPPVPPVPPVPARPSPGVVKQGHSGKKG
ncbi:uncharacterized protein TNCT_650981 [Trichonephila clavata]|uniref:Uncharacterized protein n=1 Tax=Trichonephila clavata TaxID=2740835 RepID=A0A8X6FXF2_TRICU|nr:uncharacterized protein TNCT_650981 [Trichonephila clavata]